MSASPCLAAASSDHTTNTASPQPAASAGQPIASAAPAAAPPRAARAPRVSRPRSFPARHQLISPTHGVGPHVEEDDRAGTQMLRLEELRPERARLAVLQEHDRAP